jgi:hypothetical protein
MAETRPRPDPTGPFPTLSDGSGATTEQRSAFGRLQDILRSWGLEALANDVWNQILAGEPDTAVVRYIREHDVYRKRFTGMQAMRDNGWPAISEAEYLQLESTYRTILADVGVEPARLRDPNTYTQFFARNQSPNELKERADIWFSITHAPEMTAKIRASFKQFAGLDQIDDAKFFNMLTGIDSEPLSKYVDSQGGKGIPLSIEGLRVQLRRSLAAEAARFRGASMPDRDREGISGLTGQDFT